MFFTACQDKTKSNKEGLVIDFIPDVYISISDSNLMRDGAHQLYKGEVFSGYLVDYFDPDSLKEKEGYLNGLREGNSIKYYTTGQVKEKRNYHQNDKEGIHEGWWENGNRKFEYHFENGKNEGIAIEWYASGQLFKEFNYLSGKENGSQKMLEVDGKIRANYVVKNGHRYGLIGLKNCKSVSDEKGSYAALAY